MKKKGAKIKRNHKNLYKKRKSTGRKVFEVILLLIIVGALVFVGYSVAPTVINFFNERAEENSTPSEPVWTPPVSTAPESTPPETTAAPSTTKPAEQKPAEQGLTLVAPDGTLNSAQTLTKYLNSVKDKCSQVVFVLKNTDGELLYKSDNKTAKSSDTVIKGTLTLKQIVDECKKAGVVPAAAFSTLLDRTTPHLIDSTSYHASEGWMWLDNYANKGGKPWVNPAADKASEYFGELTKEISDAGFKTILLQNTMFPAFRQYDYNLLPSSVKANDRADRLSSLAASLAASAKNSASYIEIDADDLISAAAATYDATAEIFSSIDKAKGCEIVIHIDTAMFGTKLDIANGKTLQVEKDMAKALPQLITEVKKLTGDKDITVRLSGDITDTAAAEKLLTDAGCKAVMLG